LAGDKFRRETPDYERWIILDFLGFSRPNPAFSMGYAAFSSEKNSRRLFRPAEAPGPATVFASLQKVQDRSCRKLNLVSDFLQRNVDTKVLVAAGSAQHGRCARCLRGPPHPWSSACPKPSYLFFLYIR
jgi:hypothetical protein